MTRALTGSDGERGSASIVGCAVMAALIAVTAAMLHAGSAVTARHRAQAAADLAALAVASALDRGSASACERADPIAARMQVRVRRCTITDWDAVVEVVAPVPVLGGREATAVARAGPVE
ncbi:Rv3654c family TadE-like protein [Rhodococcus chondri]|uniref:Flp pilus-assembly TadE/G-like family protein n=1 Tax=Rhodococcus chondri TaxID=3065941 RepID=A0ABU7JWR0_9NOCA|nr:Rv3654c family TadE-like protein [Rhodococcus sp. CC-R104]MEE2034463.1 flp pilus-assembly TadE/G-like family protein [Rhodococcus sp. CC-R104]